MNNAPDNPELDSELNARWREHSSEMPPVSLDVAILAAAHRAVASKPTDSAPQDSGSKPTVSAPQDSGSKPTVSAPQDSDSKVREIGTPVRAATGPQRWWMPLAAAATIGAVAIGVLQTAPQEQSDGVPAATIVAPAPNPIPPRDMYSLEPPMPAPSPAITAPEKVTAMPRKDAPLGERRAGAALVSPMPRAEADAAPPPMPAGKLATTTNVAPEPFPADRKKEAADSLSAQTPQSPRAPAASPPAATVAAAAEPARMASPANDEARQRSNVTPEKAARSDLAQAGPTASGATLLAKSRASAESGAMRAIDVDATILRIRKLHDDGKLAEAAKELIALRNAVPDADSRLPPELRAWAATVRP